LLLSHIQLKSSYGKVVFYVQLLLACQKGIKEIQINDKYINTMLNSHMKA